MARIAVEGSGGKRAAAVRQTTGSVAGSGAVSVVLVLPQAMASTSYTAVAVVEDSTGDLTVRAVLARTTTDVTVQVRNTNAVTARTGTVHLFVQAD